MSIAEPRLIKWAKEGFQPIDLNKEVSAVTELIRHSRSLESQVKELREAGNALIEAMNQYSFFADGYRNGSASISEVQHANDQQNEAYSKMFDVLKSLNKQP